ncbi:MAG: pre-peptidase C-terminal domain-containing protein, partial [Promethearchaeota archaeon]
SSDLRRVTIVWSDLNSYFDEFAYMAAIPMSVFHDASGRVFTSPILFSDMDENSKALLSDWKQYCDIYGGIDQAIGIGNMTQEEQDSVQTLIDRRVFPILEGRDLYDLTARMALFDWGRPGKAVLALVGQPSQPRVMDFSLPEMIFSNVQTNTTIFSNFTMPLAWNNKTVVIGEDTGWVEIFVDWSGDSILSHSIIDPTGFCIDNTTAFTADYTRVHGNQKLVSLIPAVVNGSWTICILNESIDVPQENYTITMKESPGIRYNVEVPSATEWLNVSINWANPYKDADLFLINPEGRLIDWSVTANTVFPSEEVSVPYPQPGNWTILVSWWRGSGSLSVRGGYRISTYDENLTGYIESASNGAVIASLQNIPLLYVEPDELRDVTKDALEFMDVNEIILVDVANMSTQNMLSTLTDISEVTHLANSSAIFSFIKSIGSSEDIILTVPAGPEGGVFAPASLIAAYQGASVLFLSETNSSNLAEGTWTVYGMRVASNLKSVESHPAYFEGSYLEERVPQYHAMTEVADMFGQWLLENGATGNETLTVVAPSARIRQTLDRAIVGQFVVGRFPEEFPELDSHICRSILYYALIFVNSGRLTALSTYYAYLHGTGFTDNAGINHTIHERDDGFAAMIDCGLSLVNHTGVEEIVSTLDAGVGLWTLSTHGVLDLAGIRENSMLLLRNTDAGWWYEPGANLTHPDANGDGIVDPLYWNQEEMYHYYLSSQSIDESLENIHSTLILVAACLVGSSFAEVFIRHGAVAVVSSPRTVDFEAAAWFMYQLIQKIGESYTLGEAFRIALENTSSIYSKHLLCDYAHGKGDFSLQYTLFGDPHLSLTNSSHTIPASLDPLSLDIDEHVPGHARGKIAILGEKGYLLNDIADLNAMYNLNYTYVYYNTTLMQIDELMIDIFEFQTVVIESGVSQKEDSRISMHNETIREYVNRGGTLIVLNVTDCRLEWIPGVYSSPEFGNEISITRREHPLVSLPSSLNGDVPYYGYFEVYDPAYHVIAYGDEKPVWLAATFGFGKITVMTIAPDVDDNTPYIRNLLDWHNVLGLAISSYDFSSSVLTYYSGDRIEITITLSDLCHWPVANVTLKVYIETVEASVKEIGDGVYGATINTSGLSGQFAVRIEAWSKNFDPIAHEIVVIIRKKPWIVSIFPIPIILLLVVAITLKVRKKIQKEV